MSNTPSFFSRLSHWFTPADDDAASRGGSLPLESATLTVDRDEDASTDNVPVLTHLRPWARRDTALTQLQEGFTTLNSLVGSVKENLDRHARQQDEMIHLLRLLPDALRTNPDNARTQAETLKAVGEQLQRHNGQYQRLADVLDKVAGAASNQAKVLDAVNDKVESIAQTDRSLVDPMRRVSSAMEGVSNNTHAIAGVLEQLTSSAGDRDATLHRILRRQNRRLTLLLGVAIAFSVTAMTAACLIGWKLLR
jgi:hypothetical protein